MSFDSFDSFLNGALSGRYQRIVCHKLINSTQGNRVWQSGWPSDGQPTTGSYGTLGLANGRVCDQTTSGSINFITASNFRSNYLLNVYISGNTASNVLSFTTIIDRIADCLVSHSSSTGVITGLDATSRLGSTSGPGDGAQIFIEVQSTFSAAANSFRVQYTNQNGLTGRITPVFNTVSARGVGNSATETMYVPLQSGDTGVRSIQAITQSSGTATGQMAICLVKPLYETNLVTVGNPVQKDSIFELRGAPKIYNESCLSFLNATHSGGGSRALYFEIILGEA